MSGTKSKNGRLSLEDLKDVVTAEEGNEFTPLAEKDYGRADIVTTIAYMIGVNNENLKNWYGKRNPALIEALGKSKEATIIQYLCNVRTSLMKHFLAVDNEIVYNMSNLDRMPQYFNVDEIKKLQEWGLNLIQVNFRATAYISRVNKLIDDKIDACKKLFPESINWSYVRDFFVIPKYGDERTMKTEYERFKANFMCYPFQLYVHWYPESQGNILSGDEKFLKIMYNQHGEAFTDGEKYRTSTHGTKEDLHEFLTSAGKAAIVVDCENSDPYKLCGILKGLSEEDVSRIQKIVLYDDSNTTIAWDYVAHFAPVHVEHVEVQRVVYGKSRVDMTLALGTARLFFEEKIDSFLLCSSDSDFWSLISGIPEASFAVLYEEEKCGAAIKETMTAADIPHYAMDNFYVDGAADLQKVVLRKTLESYLSGIIGENAWELTRRVYSDAYITASESEMKRFYEKYVAKLKLKIGDDGRFFVELTE